MKRYVNSRKVTRQKDKLRSEAVKLEENVKLKKEI